MDRLRSSRLFRCLVCLILVCCLVFTWATVPVRASVAVTTMYGLGLAALLLLGACGVVFNPTSTAHIEAIGQSWSDYMYASAQTDEEVEIIDVTFGLVFDEITDPPEDPRISSGGWSVFFMGKALEWVERFLTSDSSISYPSVNAAGSKNCSLGAVLPAGTEFWNDPVIGVTLSSDVYVCSWYSVSQEVYSSGVYREDIILTTYLATPESGVTYTFTNGASGTFTDKVSTDLGLFYYITLTYSGRTISSYAKTDKYDSVYSFLPGRYYWTSNIGVGPFIEGCLNFSLSSTDVNSYVTPNIITGGIKIAVDDGYDIQDITLPDLEYGNIITEGQTLEEAITQTQTQLIDGTMTWEQYVDLLTNGNGINITINNGGGTSNDYPINNDGVSSTPLTPTELAPYVVDLRDFFPFCIPFDLYDFFSLLAAEPEAPVFHWEIQDLAGNIYPIDIDLSSWDTFALVFRKMQLLVFVIGLAMASRKFIKW